MTLDWQTLLSLAILVAFAVMIFKGGSRNPVGTGSLQKQLNTIGSDVRRMAERMGSLASKEELATLRHDVESIEEHTASSGEIIALQGEIIGLREKFEGRCGSLDEKIGGVARAADRTEAGVIRIETIILQKGLNG